MVCPVIIGCRTSDFPPDELAAFRRYQPFGLIIFGEVAAKGKDAVRHVIQQFREAVMRPDAPALIDQEGGAVTRLKSSYGHGWRDIPGAHVFAELALKDLAKAREAIFCNAQLIAADMREIDLTVDCAPVLDVFTDDTYRGGDTAEGLHAASGDLRQRMLGSDPRIVADLGRAFCEGLMNQGVVPVLKHIPGYGRVKADPHYTVTKIDLPVEELASDFLPFNVLSDMPAAMTGHITFSKIDPQNSATLSPKIISMIRNIGFKNLLITDAIEMNAVWPEAFSKEIGVDQFGMALPKPDMIGEITKRALAAGCDLVLHGDNSRNFDHTAEMMHAAPGINHAQFTRINTLLKPAQRQSFDRYHTQDRLKELLQ